MVSIANGVMHLNSQRHQKTVILFSIAADGEDRRQIRISFLQVQVKGGKGGPGNGRDIEEVVIGCLLR